MGLGSQKQPPICGRLEALLEIRPNVLDGPFLLIVSDHAQLLLMLGYQVWPKVWNTQMPAEYVGVESLYRGGILESRRYLKIPKEYGDKIPLDYVLPLALEEPALLIPHDNKIHS
jgi:hypothetical protein